MPRYLLMHRHDDAECTSTFEAWTGFESAVLSGRPPATCRQASHTQTWMVEADDPAAALLLLPQRVAERTDAIEIG
jgi:hypothetical protein